MLPLAALLLLPAAPRPVPATESSAFRSLGVLPQASASFGSGISPDGTVVVGGTHPFWNGEAFRWSRGQGLADLGDSAVGLGRDHALDASSGGGVIVGAAVVGCYVFHCKFEAFRWTAGEGLVSLGAATSHANAVSGDGTVIVGKMDGVFHGGAFRWTAATGTVPIGVAPWIASSEALDVSEDGAAVVGVAHDDNGSLHAFRWTEAEDLVTLPPLAGGTGNAAALATNADGSVVVGWSRSDNGDEAFRWSASGGTVGLGELGGATTSFRSKALAVSGDGSIVVGSGRIGLFGLGGTAFVWDATNGMRDLRLVLEQEHGLDLAGWTLNAASAISSDGRTITGHGLSPQGRTEAWLAVLGAPAPVRRYCAAKTNSLGCDPRILWSGTPSANAPVPFRIEAENVRSGQPGMLVLGFAPAESPFHGGTLCVAAPVVRTPVQLASGPASPPDCARRSYSFDMGRLIRSGSHPGLAPGATVYAQILSRDPGSEGGLGLTDALRFVIAP